MTGRVVVVGSITVDLVTHVDRVPVTGETVPGRGLERHAGGRGSHRAVAAREAGADVTLVAAVGDDDAGRASAERLRRRGIHLLLTVVPDTPTGHALVTVDDDGERTVVLDPGANAHLVASSAELVGDLRPGDVLLLEGGLPTSALVAVAHLGLAAGARLVLGGPLSEGFPHDLVARADPLVVNEDGARLLADGDLLPGSLLVTFGAAGASWDGQRAYAPALPTEVVVDPSGAGDAFVGALAAALATGGDRADALAAATAAGAAAVQRRGAQPDPLL